MSSIRKLSVTCYWNIKKLETPKNNFLEKAETSQKKREKLNLFFAFTKHVPFFHNLTPLLLLDGCIPGWGGSCKYKQLDDLRSYSKYKCLVKANFVVFKILKAKK